MKCRRCKDRTAEVVLKRHNTAFCRVCFTPFFENQVKKAIKEFSLFTKDEKILVCVSGGKDSLVLWDVLIRLGYHASGMYIDLGIDDYSSPSREKVEVFAEKRKLTPIIIDLSREGMTVPRAVNYTRKKECSLCGTIKRHYFNSTARKEGYPVVATGHNLDDEAGRLMGNFLQWNSDYIWKQRPLLGETASGMVKKVKPLIRLTEYETACYALIRDIDYMVHECPFSKGATSLIYKEALNLIEEEMPGTKGRFLFGHYRGELLRSAGREDEDTISQAEFRDSRCASCGEPSYADRCGFCRLKDEVERNQGKREKEAL